MLKKKLILERYWLSILFFLQTIIYIYLNKLYCVKNILLDKFFKHSNNNNNKIKIWTSKKKHDWTLFYFMYVLLHKFTCNFFIYFKISILPKFN
jgi:hypothetical protein